MGRIKLVVRYDGTAYKGWQKQDGKDTIEGVLNQALATLLPDEKPEVEGASRTDSGVHALGNVACFDTDCTIPGERFYRALNRYLPEDVRVMASAEVSEDFHPRFTPHEKQYCYRIDRGEIPDPLRLRYSYHYSFPLDLSAMRQAAADLEGEHDFRSLVNPDSQVFARGGDAVRTIYRIEIQETGPEELSIFVSGSGFLYHQIRILVGTLLEVGSGKRRADSMPALLAARDRKLAGKTVPAKGLCLQALHYPEDEEIRG